MSRRTMIGTIGVLGGSALAAAAFVVAPTAGAAPVTVGFAYTGDTQTWTVPEGVSEITVAAWGAQGGDNTGDGCDDVGGLGGYAEATIPVTPGEVLTVVVGGRGGGSNPAGQGVGGFNGGGDAGVSGLQNIYAAGGGGATDVRVGGASLGDRVIVAGGGGGVGSACTGAGNGGAGGGTTGGDGADGGGGGGTQSAGGAGDGAGASGVLGTGGHGGDGTETQPRAGGGGGGGLYGGGGGTNAATSGESTSSGGGGSGLCPATCIAFDTGVNTGDGAVEISYSVGTGSTTTSTTAPPASAAATAAPTFTG